MRRNLLAWARRLSARRAPARHTPARLCVAAAVLACACLTPTARAQEQYRLQDQQWQAQQPADPATPEGRLQEVRKLLAQDKPARAREAADRWITDHPNHPLLVEAYLLRGDARTANGDYYKALFDYEYVLRVYPASEQFTTALEREFHIATLFASGTKRKLWGMRIVSAASEAEEIFIRIQERAPGSEVGEKASLALGDFYYDRAEMTSAAEAYDLFLENYPRSQYRERVMLRLIQASLARFKGPRFDSTGLLDASQRIRAYQNEFPAAAERMGSDAVLVRIEESLALKDYYNAQWYERQARDTSAAYMYRRVLRDYPDTAAARLAVKRLGAMAQPVQEAPPTVEGGTPMPLKADDTLEVPADEIKPADDPQAPAAPANAEPKP